MEQIKTKDQLLLGDVLLLNDGSRATIIGVTNFNPGGDEFLLYTPVVQAYDKDRRTFNFASWKDSLSELGISDWIEGAEIYNGKNVIWLCETDLGEGPYILFDENFYSLNELLNQLDNGTI